MKLYDVQVRVAEDRLATILGCLVGEAEILGMAPASAEAQPREAEPKPLINCNRANHAPVSQTRLGKAVLAALEAARGECTVLVLGAALDYEGFAPTSAGPALSALAREGLVEKVARGRYRLTAPKPAAAQGTANGLAVDPKLLSGTAACALNAGAGK